MNTINFGTKYQGCTYEDVLNRDLSYCDFIHRCPSNERTCHFKNWLIDNIDAAKKKKIRRRYIKND